MQTKQISDEVRREIEGFSNFLHADGVVLTGIDLHEVVNALTTGAAIELEFLKVETGRKLIESDDGLQLVANCTVLTEQFGDIRDLDIQTSARGVFDFTATYYARLTDAGFMGPSHYGVDLQFHVNNQGRATYVKLKS